jgi:RimJ/RimL family protein N-acetyltransferase
MGPMSSNAAEKTVALATGNVTIPADGSGQQSERLTRNPRWRPAGPADTVPGVSTPAHWQDSELDGPRVRLEPLRIDHAAEIAPLLDDPGLHTFTGGRPASLKELQQTYRRRRAGRSPDGTQRWLNWVVRRREDRRPLGTVQATVSRDAAGFTAEVAWVIGAAYQGCGYAREAAQVMAVWLRQQGATRLVAHVHPEHVASALVARSIGLAPTSIIIDGEVRWEG